VGRAESREDDSCVHRQLKEGPCLMAENGRSPLRASPFMTMRTGTFLYPRRYEEFEQQVEAASMCFRIGIWSLLLPKVCAVLAIHPSIPATFRPRFREAGQWTRCAPLSSCAVMMTQQVRVGGRPLPSKRRSFFFFGAGACWSAATSVQFATDQKWTEERGRYKAVKPVFPKVVAKPMSMFIALFMKPPKVRRRQIGYRQTLKFPGLSWIVGKRLASVWIRLLGT